MTNCREGAWGRSPGQWRRALGLLASGLACGELTAPDQEQLRLPAQAEGAAGTAADSQGPPGSSASQSNATGRVPPASTGERSTAEPTPVLVDAAAPDVAAPPNIGDAPDAGPPPELAPLLPPGARPGRGSVVDLVAGFAHTCALLDTGQVRCWGDGTVLGYADSELLLQGETVGDDESPATAGFVELGGPVRKLTGGESHTCALLDSGAVRCWGDGSWEELGYGDGQIVGDDETPASMGDVPIAGVARDLVGGSEVTCALLEDAAQCWGPYDS